MHFKCDIRGCKRERVRLNSTFGRIDLIRNICIRMQAKHFGCVAGRQTVDVLGVCVQIARHRHTIAFVKLKTGAEQRFVEPNVGECDQQTFVEVIGDATAVHHLAQHVAHRLPRHTFLRIHFVQVILYELNAGSEVGLIEFVRYVPAERTEFPALLDDGVQKGDGVQQRWPLRCRCVVQKILRKCLSNAKIH